MWEELKTETTGMQLSTFSSIAYVNPPDKAMKEREMSAEIVWHKEV